MSENLDERWLDAAARLATGALGSTGKTPAVGALIVDPARQLVFGRAVTPPRGLAQAERLAIDDAAGLTTGRTLYMTLEPAARYGTLAPSIEAIVDVGIARIVVGALDPDPARAGEGLRALAAAGVEAVHLPHGLSQRINEGPAMRHARGRPFVTLKITLSEDGMVGYARPGLSLPYGIESQRFIERQRAAADAVMAGAARAEIEDNDLSVHLDGLEHHDALRVVLAGSRPLAVGQDLFAAVSGVPLLVVTTEERPLALRPGIEVATVNGRHGRPDLRRVLTLLGERGINRLFVEAGARLAESLIAGELVDRLMVIDVPGRLGKAGVPAALLGHFEDRIAAARFSEVDRRWQGEDKVRSFERL